MRRVVDASMALAFVLADEFTDVAAIVLADIGSSGALVPALWDFEVLNGLRSAERRGRLSPAALTTAVRGLALLPIQRDPRVVDGLRLTDLARRHDLSVYDAAYLALAMDAGLPLATMDTDLAAAAVTAGLVVVGATTA